MTGLDLHEQIIAAHLPICTQVHARLINPWCHWYCKFCWDYNIHFHFHYSSATCKGEHSTEVLQWCVDLHLQGICHQPAEEEKGTVVAPSWFHTHNNVLLWTCKYKNRSHTHKQSGRNECEAGVLHPTIGERRGQHEEIVLAPDVPSDYLLCCLKHYLCLWNGQVYMYLWFNSISLEQEQCTTCKPC